MHKEKVIFPYTRKNAIFPITWKSHLSMHKEKAISPYARRRSYFHAQGAGHLSMNKDKVIFPFKKCHLSKHRESASCVQLDLFPGRTPSFVRKLDIIMKTRSSGHEPNTNKVKQWKVCKTSKWKWWKLRIAAGECHLFEPWFPQTWQFVSGKGHVDCDSTFS